MANSVIYFVDGTLRTGGPEVTWFHDYMYNGFLTSPRVPETDLEKPWFHRNVYNMGGVGIIRSRMVVSESVANDLVQVSDVPIIPVKAWLPFYYKWSVENCDYENDPVYIQMIERFDPGSFLRAMSFFASHFPSQDTPQLYEVRPPDIKTLAATDLATVKLKILDGNVSPIETTRRGMVQSMGFWCNEAVYSVLHNHLNDLFFDVRQFAV